MQKYTKKKIKNMNKKMKEIEYKETANIQQFHNIYPGGLHYVFVVA